MKYVKVDKYIVILESIHGVMHQLLPGVTPQVIITYMQGLSACLEFADKETSQKAFDKIADALGAN